MTKDFKFFLITDTHFFKNSLGAYGEGYDAHMEYEQKCFAETEAINRAAFKYLMDSDEADTVLIAGDLTHNGEKESHEEFKKLLEALRDSGKKIYVVTAGHDISPTPFCYPGTKEQQRCEGITFADLYSYYGEFGYKDAIAFNPEHMSYVAQLTDGIRLLVICNDTAEGRNVPYDDEFYGWMKEQLDKAKTDGQMIFAMEHYPVIPGQPILSFIDDAREANGQKLIDLLADNGCNLIFTGHMHNQSINVAESSNGNKFYDVCTGSLIGFPAFMRLCTIKDESTVDIKSIPVPDFEWDTKGKTCEQYLQDQFDGMIINLLKGMKDDPERTMRKIRLKQNKVTTTLVQKLGKAVCEKTVGQTVKIFAVKAEPEIKDMPLLDFLAAIVRNVFAGDQPYTEDTPGGKTFLKVIRRFNPILKILNSKITDCQGAPVDLYEILKHSAGNYGISDSNAVLKLK